MSWAAFVYHCNRICVGYISGQQDSSPGGCHCAARPLLAQGGVELPQRVILNICKLELGKHEPGQYCIFQTPAPTTLNSSAWALLAHLGRRRSPLARQVKHLLFPLDFERCLLLLHWGSPLGRPLTVFLLGGCLLLRRRFGPGCTVFLLYHFRASLLRQRPAQTFPCPNHEVVATACLAFLHIPCVVTSGCVVISGCVALP